MFWVLQVVGSNPAAPTSPEVERHFRCSEALVTGGAGPQGSIQPTMRQAIQASAQIHPSITSPATPIPQIANRELPASGASETFSCVSIWPTDSSCRAVCCSCVSAGSRRFTAALRLKRTWALREKAATHISGIGCEMRGRKAPAARDSSRPAARFARHRQGLIEPLGRRQRHICVGDFSAQCLNGRRQAIILRLRGVALFPAALVSSTRASRAETGRTTRPPGCHWRLAAALVTAFLRSTRAAPFGARGADVHIAVSLLLSPANQFFQTSDRLQSSV
ncbi:hypothetical protein ACVIIV_005304 [Bradyrhizobium sp. USDA 4354]